MLAGGTTVAEVIAVVELAADVAADPASAVEDGAVEDGTTAVPVPVGPAPSLEPGTG